MYKHWILFFLVDLVLLPPAIAFEPATVPSALPYSEIRDEHLKASGVAFDAREDILGMIHIDEPKTFFKPDTSQVTWWGEFDEFEAWTRPQLEARWYNPQGQLLQTQQFRGTICRLAKTTLQMQDLQQQGRWHVEIYYKGELLDRKDFFLYDAKAPMTAQIQPTVEVVPTPSQ